MFLKMSGYVRRFDETKYMPFLIEDKKSCKTCNNA